MVRSGENILLNVSYKKNQDINFCQNIIPKELLTFDILLDPEDFCEQ